MRLKIIAGNLAVVLLLGISAYVMISGEVRTDLVQRADSRLAGDRVLFERSYKLSAREFLSLVEARAGMDGLRSVFSGLDESSRRTRAYDAAEGTQAWLSDPARGDWGTPDIVIVADETGRALARNGARNVMFGKSLMRSIPALSRALRTGRPVHDIWVEKQEQKVLQTAVAPVMGPSGSVLGALIVGYDLSNGVAKREADLLGREVAFVVAGRVYSSSLAGHGSKTLGEQLFGALKSDTEAVLSGENVASRVWSFRLGGADFGGVLARLPMSSDLPVAFAVLANRTEAASPASAADIVLIMMLLASVMVSSYGFVLGSSLVRPIEAIEEGILAIINGRTDLRLETDSAELGGLAYRINQLLNVFTGTEEDLGDSVSGQDTWGASSEATGESAPSPEQSPSPALPSGATATEARQGPSAAGGADEVVDDPEIAAQISAESEADYGARVYQAYVAAKEELGENVSNIPQERFLQRLAGRATALAKKHSCSSVRFQVHTRNKQVVLRPVLIR